jgi:hypothetical protein
MATMSRSWIINTTKTYHKVNEGSSYSGSDIATV